MDESAVAYIYDFEHVPLAGHEAAIERYEAHLLRYALGLERAGIAVRIPLHRKHGGIPGRRLRGRPWRPL